MIKKLSRKVEMFITDQNEALDYVDERLAEPEGQYITGQQVQLKSNKNGSYYRVVLEYKYNTPAGIMETDEFEDTQLDPEKDDGGDGELTPPGEDDDTTNDESEDDE
ncbi:hypothetical protein HZF13_05480 [Lactiplantibacillus plantarum]|uniref:hypothetical protein n=1 Tax=Lactiplantibacillus plantarum TaxID=1590 RepID=UPI001CA470A6|nr:hypothetical protein [Lactiplantibacillus plantarum]QYC98891.1 hypothetical protein HZF13_05480 [Lactiplantibacillus plantarum]